MTAIGLLRDAFQISFQELKMVLVIAKINDYFIYSTFLVFWFIMRSLQMSVKKERRGRIFAWECDLNEVKKQQYLLVYLFEAFSFLN